MDSERSCAALGEERPFNNNLSLCHTLKRVIFISY